MAGEARSPVRAVPAIAVDAAFAVVLGALAVATIYHQDVNVGMRHPGALGALAAVAGSAPVALRRRYPVAALTVVLAVTAAVFTAGYPEGSLSVNCLVLTYSVAAWTPPRRAAIGLALSLFTVVALSFADRAEYETANTFFVFVAGWLGGSAMRWRRESVRSELEAARERAEIDRQVTARLLAEERLRIAQELHDVVAHSMSVIAVQAGAGSHLLADRPDQAREALDAISSTSRSTLAEMRRLLGVLRDEDGERSNAPAPGVDDLPQLLEDVRAAGVPAELHVSGPAVGLNPSIELSAYRIVQEALTNVIKHAGATGSVDVTLERAPSELRIEVVDDGRGAAAHPGVSDDESSTGHGLVGMRERVEVWGGRFECGPRPGGGWRVRASLPLGEPV